MKRILFLVLFLFSVHAQAYAPVFQNCLPEEEASLLYPITEFVDMLNNTTLYSFGMTGQIKNTYHFFYWFGDWMRQTVTTVKTDVVSIANGLTGVTPLTFDCHAELLNPVNCIGNYAWTTYEDIQGPHYVSLCPRFWEDQVYLNTLGTLLIFAHEMAHNIAGSQDITGTIEEARELVLLGSQQDPGPWFAASFNSYNMEGFYGACYAAPPMQQGCSVAGKNRTSASLSFLFLIIFSTMLQRRRRL